VHCHFSIIYYLQNCKIEKVLNYTFSTGAASNVFCCLSNQRLYTICICNSLVFAFLRIIPSQIFKWKLYLHWVEIIPRDLFSGKLPKYYSIAVNIRPRWTEIGGGKEKKRKKLFPSLGQKTLQSEVEKFNVFPAQRVEHTSHQRVHYGELRVPSIEATTAKYGK
jgi:hypothetical protein